MTTEIEELDQVRLIKEVNGHKPGTKGMVTDFVVNRNGKVIGYVLILHKENRGDEEILDVHIDEVEKA